MGFADGLQFVGGSLSPVQPNPLKRTSITPYEAAKKSIAERSDGAYGILEGQAKVVAHACGDEETVQKPTKKRKKTTEGSKEERGRVKMAQKDATEVPDSIRPLLDQHVLHRVLRAPLQLQYQLAFTSSELREIFANAPPIPSGSLSDSPSSSSSHRKPIEDDCPICCCPFETEGDDADDIVWCKASCGNNIHKTCFEQWAATKKVANYGSAAQVTCPFCRSPWQGDEDSLKKIAKCGAKNAEGYVNVAEQLGISQERDLSTYHQSWVRQQQKAGKLERYY
ncbi:MAG: hypothetical protein Q9165_000670 [Trypethelium subeluteriae]